MLTIKKALRLRSGQAINKIILKRVLSITLLSILLIGMVYFTLMPAVIEATYPAAGPVSVVASLSVTKEIDITAPSNFSLTPSIPGMSGNLGSPSSASAAFTVISNAAAGFDMKIYASQAYALYLGTPTDQYFSDYAPVAASTPDFAWQSPAAAAAWFGYSVGAGTSADADQEFKNASSACNASGGANSTANCFFGMTTTPGTRIIHRTSYTSSTGETETVKFLAESNQAFLKEGTYTATITATVSTN